MKKLAVFLYSMGPGGAERVVSNLLPALCKKYEVHLVLMSEVVAYEIPSAVKIHFLERSDPYESGVKKLFRLAFALPSLALKYKKLCETLKQDIDDAGKRNITERLKRFFLGKNQKFMQYKNKLDELKTKQLSSLEKSDRKELVKSINEIRQNISSDKRDIDNEIEKAKIDDAFDAESQT